MRRAVCCRNKREFWERDDRLGVEDGFELVYQFWVAYGLEKGAAVARRVGDTATAARWEKEAARLKEAMLNDPVYRFVEEGHLIKRRTRDGRWQRYFIPPNRNAASAGSPLATIEKPEGDPDTGSLYPIIYGMIDPRRRRGRRDDRVHGHPLEPAVGFRRVCAVQHRQRAGSSGSVAYRVDARGPCCAGGRRS